MNPILSKIYPTDIYEGLHLVDESLTGWGGNDPIFTRLIRRLRPKTIIEVGTWKGQSAINMAELCRVYDLSSSIICIDTWLGSEEHILNCSPDLRQINGYPSMYYQFLSNVVHRNVQNLIVPLPTSSITGASILRTLDIKADLIYIDASHQYEAVVGDITAFRPLLSNKGLLFGHDRSWPSVIRAVQDYCKEYRCWYHTEKEFWILNTE